MHALYIAMHLKKNQIHYFSDIGYFHSPYGVCKSEFAQCSCPADFRNIDESKGFDCSRDWITYQEKLWMPWLIVILIINEPSANIDGLLFRKYNSVIEI